jgi:ribonuclease VapC
LIAIDTSAIVAIALREPEAQLFGDLIGSHECVIGWPTVLEAHLVLAKIPRKEGLRVLQKVLDAPRIRTVPFDQRTYQSAHDAFDRFGRGRHPADLNFGDCMAYAVARAYDVPLLYKGADFALTDIAAALS